MEGLPYSSWARSQLKFSYSFVVSQAKDTLQENLLKSTQASSEENKHRYELKLWTWAGAAQLARSYRWASLHWSQWFGRNSCLNSSSYLGGLIFFQMSCSLNAVWSWRFAQFSLEFHCKYHQDVCMSPAAIWPPVLALPEKCKGRRKIVAHEDLDQCCNKHSPLKTKM